MKNNSINIDITIFSDTCRYECIIRFNHLGNPITLEDAIVNISDWCKSFVMIYVHRIWRLYVGDHPKSSLEEVGWEESSSMSQRKPQLMDWDMMKMLLNPFWWFFRVFTWTNLCSQIETTETLGCRVFSFIRLDLI